MEPDPAPMGLIDLPAELRHYIGHYLDEARDVAACILAHPHLLARPLLYWLGRMCASISVGDVLEASAPLDIVAGLFDQWRIEPLPAMVVDAAAGGRVDVLRWLLCRLDATSLVDCEICHLSHRSRPSNCSFSSDDSDSDTDTPSASVVLDDCLSSDTDDAYNEATCSCDADTGDDDGTPLAQHCNDASSTKSCWHTRSPPSSNDNDKRSGRRSRPRRPRKRTKGTARRSLGSKNGHTTFTDDSVNHNGDDDDDDDDECIVTYYAGVLIPALRKAAERDHVEVLTCLLTEAPPPGRVPSPLLLDAIAIATATRGSLGILAALHEWSLAKGRGVCGCPDKVGLEAMSADRVDVLDWLAATGCTGALVLDQAILDKMPGHPLPHFARWAVSKLPPHVRVGPKRLWQLAGLDCVETLKTLHETDLGVCSKETLRAAATHGSMDVLKWAAGESPGAAPLAAWNPIDVAAQAASHGRKGVVRWLATRSDADRVLTVGVARLALSRGFTKVAAAVRPLDQWDALAIVVSHKDLPEVAEVVHYGARCTPEVMAAAMRRRDERILELLCRKYGTAMVPDAVEFAAGTRCSLNCVRWLSDAVLCGHVPDSVCVAHLWASAAVEWPDGAQSCCMCSRCNPCDGD
ncbi:hypothetical protein pqer_cds_155 [Pandoravirus quercus]|uniref:Ankyrin repeat domain containing protein n=1 Tax=Pandoravirus quercus TaxID=2107709 RepID=A0A2U7U829_9VIRU|nr:hypothetical protein pqer_cds_155 [Pandoravirus quercus]AVK74577.1 hypothetical protein pqer_cds_155 [Pandoravirus quercus]